MQPSEVSTVVKGSPPQLSFSNPFSEKRLRIFLPGGGNLCSVHRHSVRLLFGEPDSLRVESSPGAETDRGGRGHCFLLDATVVWLTWHGDQVGEGMRKLIRWFIL